MVECDSGKVDESLNKLINALNKFVDANKCCTMRRLSRISKILDTIAEFTGQPYVCVSADMLYNLHKNGANIPSNVMKVVNSRLRLSEIMVKSLLRYISRILPGSIDPMEDCLRMDNIVNNFLEEIENEYAESGEALTLDKFMNELSKNFKIDVPNKEEESDSSATSNIVQH